MKYYKQILIQVFIKFKDVTNPDTSFKKNYWSSSLIIQSFYKKILIGVLQTNHNTNPCTSFMNIFLLVFYSNNLKM